MIYLVQHGMNETPAISCPDCEQPTSRMISTPNLDLGGYTSPTEERYARVSPAQEIARETELQ